MIVGTILPDTTLPERNPESNSTPTVIISSPVTVTLPRQFSFTNRTSLKHVSLDKKLSQNSTDSIKVVVETADKTNTKGCSPSPSYIAISSEEPQTEGKIPTPLISRSGKSSILN